jgi:hypothetical protein
MSQRRGTGPVRSRLARTAQRRCRPAGARQQPGQVSLAHQQRQLAQVVTGTGEHVEGVKLYLVVVLAGMKRETISSSSLRSSDSELSFVSNGD